MMDIANSYKQKRWEKDVRDFEEALEKVEHYKSKIMNCQYVEIRPHYEKMLGYYMEKVDGFDLKYQGRYK